MTILRGEFMVKDEDLSLSTMVEDASVLTVPTGWGGKGKTELRPLYRDEFIPSIPPSWTHTTTNQVVTDDYIVEEATSSSSILSRWIGSARHSPTNKLSSLTLVLIVQFRAGKMSAERIYWDQATVLRQIGQLD